MQGGVINFSEIPKIGFAHHFYVDREYHPKYGYKKGIEIVYVKKGNMLGELFDKTFLVQEGSFLILFRHLPVHLTTTGEHSHCSVELGVDYDFTYIENIENYSEQHSGLVLPFVIPPCSENEQLKKDLYVIASDMAVSKEKNEMSATLLALSVLQKLSVIYEKSKTEKQSSTSIIEYKIKKFVAQNINGELTLNNIARELNMTPNYINCVFKKQCGISIIQYVNKEKVKLMCDMVQFRCVSFKVACENVGIYDVSYGYRLFKKHTGVTVKEYINSTK